MKKNIETKKLSTWYELRTGKTKISVSKDEETGKISIANERLLRTNPMENDAWEFVFKKSDKKLVKKIGLLLIEASKL
jgi:hypothetical protein